MAGLNRFLMEEVEMPLIEVVAEMEDAGYLIDQAHFTALGEQLKNERKVVESNIAALVQPLLGGGNFNPSSTQQVADLLFKTLGLPVLKHTDKGKPSTGEEVLRQLQKDHKVVPEIRSHRELTKLIGTYCTIPDSLGEDGRLRVEFNQLGADSGRFSSSSIIQTLPKDDRLGIRKGFVAGPGSLIVAADFVQQELYMLAGVSGDQNLLAAIKEDVDLHGLAAVKVFGLECEPNEVKKKFPAERDRVKAIQFGIIYGRSPQSLAAELDIPNEEANKLLDDYFEQFPDVKGFIDSVHARVTRDGFIDDLFGRRRHLPDAKLSRPRGKYDRMSQAKKAIVSKINHAKRQAQNFVIQGACATVTKLAMLRCHRHIKAEHAKTIRMLLTLHDELQFEVVQREVDHFAAELPTLMCDLGLERFGFNVPMAVEVKVGPTWGDLKKFEKPREGCANDQGPTAHEG